MYNDTSRFYSFILSILIHVYFEKKNVLMMFADFSMAETNEGDRDTIMFTRYDYGIRRCHFGCLAALRSLSHFFMRSVPLRYMPGMREENTGKT